MTVVDWVAVVVVIVVLGACSSDAEPTTTNESRWCAQEADDGSRYYMACEP